MPCSYSHSATGACQFGPSSATIQHGDREYCQWHLPPQAKAHWSPERVAAFQADLQQHLSILETTQGSADFEGVIFAGNSDFNGLVLRNSNFQGAIFIAPASFIDATLVGPSDFRSATFHRNATFTSATFADTARFNGSTFVETATFESVKFDGFAGFDATQFRGFTNFGFATFIQEASFPSATCSGEAVFRSAKFNDADFKSAHFLMHVGFEASTFATAAGFEFVAFDQEADFNSVSFGEAALFDSATFKDVAMFDGSEFKAGGFFRSTAFPGGVYFNSARFGGDAEFASALDPNRAGIRIWSWTRAQFSKGANFENRMFKGEGDFSDATFCEAPRFHGCTLHQAMIFPTEDRFKDFHSTEAAQAYRTLKLGMAAMKSRAEEGMFFTLEQRSLRNAALAQYSGRFAVFRAHPLRWLFRGRHAQDRRSPAPMNLHEIALSAMYDAASEFGRNAFRPACLVIALWVVFTVLYAAIKGNPLNPTAPVDGQLLKHAAVFGIEQVLRPLYVWGPNSGTLYDSVTIPLRVKLLASVQSILSFALISLSLLALNWRFKRD
jgi:uncharacterized protein YjbI with pentapeptide repeats